MSRTIHERQDIASGAVWRIIEVMGAEIFAFGAFVISARLLLPAEVGVVAQATLFILAAQLIRHQGLSAALIQPDEVGPLHFFLVFWLTLVIGAAVALPLIARVDLIGMLLHGPDLPSVLRTLLPTLSLFVISGIGAGMLWLCYQDVKEIYGSFAEMLHG